MSLISGQGEDDFAAGRRAERQAEAALREQEATSRQQVLTEDARLSTARQVLAAEAAAGNGNTLTDALEDLLDFAEERLRVNRGLLAAAKPSTSQTFDLTLTSDADLLAEVKRRMERYR